MIDSEQRHPTGKRLGAGIRPLSWCVRLAAVAAVFACTAAVPPAAHATKFVDGVFAGIPDTAGGLADDELRLPRDVAVNRSAVADAATDPLGDPVDGYVYVAEHGNDRVQVFDPDGQFRFMFGGGVEDGSALPQVCDRTEVPCTGRVEGGLGGMFDGPQGVAIDQATGHVFVRDRGNLRVQEFEGDGTFVRAWGWDVAAEGASGDTAADELETCFDASGCQRGSAGAGLGQFGGATGTGGGIDLRQATGDLVVADPPNSRVLSFAIPADPSAAITAVVDIGPFPGLASSSVHVAVDADGKLYVPGDDGDIDRYDLDASMSLAPVALDEFTVPLANAPSVRGLEVHPSTGNLLVALLARTPFPENALITPVLELAAPDAASPDDVAHVDSHVDAAGLTWSGLGIDADSDELLLPHVSVDEGHRVFRAGEGPAGAASVAFLPYSDVTSDGATLNVEIASQWPLPTTYEVKVAPSSDPAAFETVAAGSVPAGNVATTESLELTGLRSRTLYLTRVVTRKPYGNPQRFFDGPVLLTKAKSPDLAAVGADSLTPDSARLTARINPNGTATGYRFEWGEAGEGLHEVVPLPDAPVGSGFGYEFVSQEITGLEPETAYEFRVVATSEDRQLGSTASAPHLFTTPGDAPPAGRAYELVSPSDKVGGVGVGQWYEGPGSASSSGQAARVGERFAVGSSFGAALLDAPFAYANDWAFADRIDRHVGWVSHTPIAHAATATEGPRFFVTTAAAPDLSLLTWKSNGGLLHVFDEMAGWVDRQVNNPSFISDWEGRWEIFGPTELRQAPVNKSAEATTAVAADADVVVGTTGVISGAGGGLRGLAGAGDPTGFMNPAPDTTVWPDLVAGKTVYVDDVSAGLADSFPGAGVREVVHVCAGGTELPAVDGAGLMGTEACEPPGADRDHRLVSAFGATAAASGSPSHSVVSADASRVFFIAPDPEPAEVPDGFGGASELCSTAGDVCPAQLFVRQKSPDGSVVTRWISRAEDGLLGSQAATLTGTVRFEGATPDGDKVFFRTNSPLTVDDPNGEAAPTPGGVTTGIASDVSWDLYLYDFPDSPTADPGDGQLTRISAGPDGDGDCNRPQAPGAGSALLRFVSDDASRVYFVCAAPLPGAVVPAHGELLTEPGGTPTTTDSANLYLYDANRPADERWRFVARLPANLTGGGMDGCATSGAQTRSPMTGAGKSGDIALLTVDINCLRGTSDGEFVTLWTRGRLTADDPDTTSGDVYGYDAESDRLLRLSAPQGGVGGTYTCVTSGAEDGQQCHGDYGFDPIGFGGVAADPLTAGARLAFFQSRSRLVPEDRDDAYDVYQWRDGALTLVSSGTSTTDGAFLMGNDRTGRNVYFVTRDALAWKDVDAVLDVYTARRGGGIAEPAQPPVCEALGGGCQDAGDGTAVPPRGDSREPAGGNGTPRRARRGARLTVARPAARARRLAARSGVLRLAVRLSRRATVRAVARARLRTRAGRRVVRRVAAARARGRGRLVLRLTLRPRARRELRRRGRLPLAVQVSAAGADARRLRLVLGGVR